MLVLILEKIRHDHKKYIHENPEINAAAKETYHRLMEAVVIKSNTNVKIFNTTAWTSCTSIFIYNSDSKVDLIADLRKFNYAIVCQFETG